MSLARSAAAEVSVSTTGWWAPPKPKPDRLRRAELAGEYVAVRDEALRSDPDLLAIRSAAEQARTAGLDAPPRPDGAQQGKRKPGQEPTRAEIVQTLATNASTDSGYRVQLISLAALHGGIYQEGMNAIYELEAETLGRFEALARLVLD